MCESACGCGCVCVLVQVRVCSVCVGVGTSACAQCVCWAQKGKERKCIEINVWANKFYSDFFPFEVVEGSNDELAFND